MGQVELSESILLIGKFSLLGSRQEYDVQLVSSALRYLPTGTDSKWKSIALDDVIGVQCMKGKTNADAKAYLTLYIYRRGRTFTGTLDRVRRRDVMVLVVNQSHVFTENLQVAHLWKETIQELLRPTVSDSQNPYGKSWLVVINPGGGQGKAHKIFTNRVVPVFAEADIFFDVVVSTHLGHVTEYCRNLDLEKYSTIVVVSGDGLIHEVVNGLMAHENWSKAIRIPLGLVPGGSGNGLAASIHEACGEPFKSDFAKHAGLMLTKSIPTPVDLLYLESLTDERYAFLSVGWGLLADIDIESEKFRNLGETRFTVGAIQRLIDLRIYSGAISYLPADHSGGDSAPLSSPAPIPDVPLAKRPPTDLLVPLSQPVPRTWTIVEGEFISVYLVLTSRLSTSGIGVPWAKLNDGLAYLFWIKSGAPKTAIATILMNMSTGDHLKSPYVEMAAVRAFRIEPKEKDGIITVDGERVQYGPMQGQVLPSLGRVLSRPISAAGTTG